jgi:hypothetical protein
LPSQNVLAEQILGLSPESQTVAPGAAAGYALQITNPASTPVTYNLSVSGVPAQWVNLPSQVTVDAGATVVTLLTLTSDPFAPLADYGFVVTATNGGTSGSVSGDLILAGAPVLPAADPIAHGIVATLSPLTASAGLGTSASYIVTLTNTGSATDMFALSAAGLPASIAAAFSQSMVVVPPGTINSRQVTLTLTPSISAAVTDDPFQVAAVSTTDAAISSSADGTLTVLPEGVSVSLSPSTGPAGSTYNLLVKNQGTVTDTFSLSLGGPAAFVSSLSVNSVTLAPGQSQNVPVTVGAIDFADAGSLQLTAIATSQTNPAVVDQTSASITIPTSTGLSTSFTPSSVTLPALGPTSFSMLVNNLGNLDDSYTATITGTTGNIAASLIGLDGLPTQSIPLFDLPGLSTGQLQLETNLAAGKQGTVTVTISDANGLVSSSTATVNIASPTTTTTVTSDHPSGSTYGQSVEFTATISGGISGTPTGSVQFEIDGTDVGMPVTVVGGTAEFTTSMLTATSHTITAVYTSDNLTNFSNSQNGVNQSVSPAPLTITADNKSKVAGSPNPTLTFTPSGFVNGDTVNSLTTQPTLSTTATTTSPANTYPITASGAVDPNYSISYVPGTLTVTAAVGTPTKTTLSVSCGSSSIVYGQSITFTATVTSSTKTGTPTGIVTFMDGSNVLGTGTLTPGHGGDVATFSTSILTAGAHTITAVYAGGGGFAGSSSSPLTQNVNKATTSIALACSIGSTGVGQPVNLTATITIKSPGGGTPTGSVTFKDGSTVLSSSPVTLVGGKYEATFSISTLAIGKHSITAVYGGDGNFSTSTSSALSVSITKDTTTTTVSSSVNPAVLGQSVTFTAVVGIPASGTPTGSVTFKDGSTTLGTEPLTLVAGQYQATFTTSSLAVASHSITAIYGGDANFSTSTSHALTESVGKDATTTILTASTNSPTYGQSVTLTAQITVVAPGSGTPTGTVTFRDGSSSLGTGTVKVVGGIAEATLTTSKLSQGNHSLTAVYGGSSSYAGSTSATLSEAVSNVAHAVSTVANPLDVNGDGVVSPLDALMIINALNSESSGTILTPALLAACDVNRDGQVTPLDALMVINAIDAAASAVNSVVTPAVAQPAVAQPSSPSTSSSQSGTVSTAQLAFALSTTPSGNSSPSRQAVDAIFGNYSDGVE